MEITRRRFVGLIAGGLVGLAAGIWRVGFKDGGRLIDRLNANERERLSSQERERAERPLSSLTPVS